jgi:hypothetical protein
MQFRHGDLLIESISVMPTDITLRPDGVLAYGTATGHSHRLAGGKVVEKDGTVYLQVADADAKITHEEHETIDLPVGEYIVTRQRQFNPYDRVITEVTD